ncbi:hypothetical protein GCM10009069_29000 [Algimonas arctica]|uniref:Heme-binding protein n=2 Tax=Algimonas arctica TaxID=1479486 RepID=A0A8J3CSU3_9PROT|nr:hypothetical protein GCM10009069_29000 [Algimonas arctica]
MTTRIRDKDVGNPSGNIGLQGVDVPATLAAISKALTGAYLSSTGNAFSSRTASQIVQEHFPPAPNTAGLESGPLFGVQFSQLPCSDLSTRAPLTAGPHRAPLGLSADPGGLPLYKNGVVVGGIGVVSDGDYGFDPDVSDVDTDVEELIAVAGATNYAAPISIRADRVSVDGSTLRYIDRDEDALLSTPSNAPSFTSLQGTTGSLVFVRSYTPGTIQAGQAYGTETSGIRRSTIAEFSNADAYVLSDGAGQNRFPIRGALDGGDVTVPLTEVEVRAVIEEAFGIMSRARGQIRRPLESRAQVSITVVDTRGNVLGLVRGPDAPIFGTDVALQKARTATFFSSASAAADLSATRRSPVLTAPATLDPKINGRVQQVRDFIGDQQALLGTVAFADRSGGNLSRPYFPDGEVGRPPGPLSVPISQFNPFSTGLQEELIEDNIIEHVTHVSTGSPDTAVGCTFMPDAGNGPRLRNGMQIFPGSVPIYRGDTLIGGVGVSGDGIDQDDMISLLGLAEAGRRTGTINNAPVDIRADQILVPLGDTNVRLRYVSCPFSPFLDSDEQNPCAGE